MIFYVSSNNVDIPMLEDYLDLHSQFSESQRIRM